jgi:hypothetical protein
MRIQLIAARFFSAILHPLIIPTLGVIILFNLDSYIAFATSVQAKRFILLTVFINTAIAPVLAIFFLKKTALIDDVLLFERKDRIIPLLLSAMFFMLTYFLFRRLPLPSLVYFYIIGATLLILTCMFITIRWKISVHMTSWGGLTGFLLVSSFALRVDILMLILISILLAGALGSSRIILKAHTPAQVYAGYLLGVFGMLLVYSFL